MEHKINDELIIGIVAPLGVDIEAAITTMEKVLRQVSYEVVKLSLSSSFLQRCKKWQAPVPQARDEYINHYQEIGNSLRKEAARSDVLASAAMLLIAEYRQGNPYIGGETKRVAFIIRQLKTPEEVKLLRTVYGERFVLVGIFAEPDTRVENMATWIMESRGEAGWTNFEGRARKLIERDDAEGVKYGQNVRDTFPISDFFVALDARSSDPKGKAEAISEFEEHFSRLIDLLLGRPDCPPTGEEFLMHQAYSIAWWSGDWSRQVGAVIATRGGSVIAAGRNDDPVVGGGVAALVSKNQTTNPSTPLKERVLKEMIERLSPWFKKAIKTLDSDLRVTRGLKLLDKTSFVGLGEFGRMVHGEMAAITDAARRGVSLEGHIMFCTTFPCQNCAKHIMASGIRALVFMEPYPKSFVKYMYASETAQLPMPPLNSGEFQELLEERPLKFYLLNFLGIAPRRYQALFTMPVRKDDKGNLLAWNPSASSLRLTPSFGSDGYLRWENKQRNTVKHFI